MGMLPPACMSSVSDLRHSIAFSLLRVWHRDALWLLVSQGGTSCDPLLSTGIPHLLPPAAPPLVRSLIAGLVLPELEASDCSPHFILPEFPSLSSRNTCQVVLLSYLKSFSDSDFPEDAFQPGRMVSLGGPFQCDFLLEPLSQRNRNTHSPVKSGPGGPLPLCVPLLLSGRPSHLYGV